MSDRDGRGERGGGKAIGREREARKSVVTITVNGKDNFIEHRTQAPSW